MASGSRKRRVSRSPSCLESARKLRRQSASNSLQSQLDTSNPYPSTAKSVFRGCHDPYFPLSTRGDTTLPTGDDYVFRIQVLSTTTNLNADVFKKAVQGLVKICFPQNVLDELGIEVVTQHMRDQDAPEQNIVKMADIFRAEMIHRVTWMLAEYLDSAGRVESSVKAIMAASASLHGAKIGEDVLSGVTESLSKLREHMSSGSTARLANSTDMELSSLNMAESDAMASNDNCTVVTQRMDRVRCTGIAPEDPSEDSMPLVSPANKHGKRECRSKSTPQLQYPDAAYRESSQAAEQMDQLVPIEQPCRGKASKVSTSWRWNVQDEISIDDITEHFKRTSDLFAYHALPIARQRLGTLVKRKKLRKDIEAMLAALSTTEFDQWVERLRKLQNGDMTMLERSPAPIIGQDAARITVKSTPTLTPSNQTVRRRPKSDVRFAVKQEHNVYENFREA
ncbi:hypothetical protein C7974DRAFT_84404 [Boeremia exigua]|uniref:uncharacterized protein n=1 Tax=Boeremia exigua TaxID=749465 RepID=UPI001E8DE451|nr:uncharacterized protein C7974DRAFT_84404 [Boeremia exigua]KAH6612727.1 hypothetical protein C7974DRAFT_84404 [Boeremia exigua]